MDDIYFAASIRGGRGDVQLYKNIIDYLGNYGRVLTEHVGDKNLAVLGEDKKTDEEIHGRDMSWLSKAKVVVAEVTTASLGVGYEIGRIVERNHHVPQEERKRILCLYRPQADKRLSAMIAGSDGVKIKEFQTFEDAKTAIDDFFNN